MTIISTNIFLQKMDEQKLKRRRLKSLRDFLLYSLQISPHSQNLVFVVGNGNERNNSEALLNWLSEGTLDDKPLANLPAHQVEGHLLRYLERRLDCWPD